MNFIIDIYVGDTSYILLITSLCVLYLHYEIITLYNNNYYY